MMVGSIGKGELEVKYGSLFPTIGDERRIFNHMGRFVIKYTWIGTPKWTSKHSVLVPAQFEIIEIIELSKKQKAKLSGFEIVQ